MFRKSGDENTKDGQDGHRDNAESPRQLLHDGYSFVRGAAVGVGGQLVMLI